MNYDEFGFFNQQLASMLRDGIPLEGALKQLCAGMQDRTLRHELQQLEQDLSQGIPLGQALAKRKLPPLYVRLLQIGVRGNDLPAMLTLIADYYHRINALWTRLKGLLVYPLLVILVSLGVTLAMSIIFTRFLGGFFEQFGASGRLASTAAVACVWLPPFTLMLLAVGTIWVVSRASLRGRLRWRLPAFHEASLARLASALSLLLRNGISLSEALSLSETLEQGTPAAAVLGEWRAQVEAGRGKPTQWSAGSKPFPPLFLWLVQQGGEDAAAGFQKAADIYQARASYRIELLLYGALPISILMLGLMVMWQVGPLMRTLIWLMNMLGDFGN
jgi:type IV pilus assembly protein PilC